MATTLDALDAAMVASQDNTPRPYLGLSQIGDPCARKLWYSVRWASKRTIQASGLRAIQDGFGGEDVMASRLRMIPGITLDTVDPATGKQWAVRSESGHIRGHLDGVISGLKEDSSVHVWEHKQVNEKKWKQLQKLVASDQGSALATWDETYHAQAQCYMGYTNLDRHFLTVGSPGGRDYLTVFTRFDEHAFAGLIERGYTIMDATDPPQRLSEKPDYFACTWCEFNPVCHGKKPAVVSCRTCCHATAVDDGKWHCKTWGDAIPEDTQRKGCSSHLYLPSMLGYGYPVDGGDNWIGYQHHESNKPFSNGTGPDGNGPSFTSVELYKCPPALLPDVITVKEIFPTAVVRTGSAFDDMPSDDIEQIKTKKEHPSKSAARKKVQQTLDALVKESEVPF